MNNDNDGPFCPAIVCDLSGRTREPGKCKFCRITPEGREDCSPY